MMMENVAIISAVRSAITKSFKGSFASTRPDDLGALVLQELIKKTNISQDYIEDLIVGCAMPEAEQGMNLSRIISLRAGLSYKTSAATINRFCASGLHAIADVAKSIASKQANCAVAMGVESMSYVPMGGHKPAPNPYLMNNHPQAYTTMGITAENVASQFNIDRKKQDEFALLSHEKACNAIKNKKFQEIVSINNDQNIAINIDEGPRAETSLEALSLLKPAFKINGSVTAGNSSQISDGAAAVLLSDKKFAQEHNFSIQGYFRAFTTVGVDPSIMGIGPVDAIKKLLQLTNLSIKDIGVFEINEAFASQAIYCIETLGIDYKKVNPYGGAIALGHPLGCTGARQVATILNYMHQNSIRYGICSMCVGGGMGAAGLIEIAAN